MYVPYLMIMGHWRIDLKPVFIMFLSVPITWGIQNSKTGTNFPELKSRKTSEFPREFPSEFFRNSYRLCISERNSNQKVKKIPSAYLGCSRSNSDRRRRFLKNSVGMPVEKADGFSYCGI